MKTLKKEVSRFLVAGFSAVGTDFLIYKILLNFMTHSPAKAISFMSGSVVAFILNKFWTFEKHDKSYSEIMKFILLYLSTLGANVTVNKISLVLFPEWIFFAFLSATGVSTILNFIGQKWWVFRERSL